MPLKSLTYGWCAGNFNLLANQDSGSGINFTALTSMQVNRKGIEIWQLFSLEMVLAFNLKGLQLQISHQIV